MSQCQFLNHSQSSTALYIIIDEEEGYAMLQIQPPPPNVWFYSYIVQCMFPSVYKQIGSILPVRQGNVRDACMCVPEHVYMNSPPI